VHSVDRKDLIIGPYSSLLQGPTLQRAMPRRDRAFLPNLTTLHWSPSYFEDLEALCHLLVPCLRTLTVVFTPATGPRDYRDCLLRVRSADYVRLAEEIMLVAPSLDDLVAHNEAISDLVVTGEMEDAYLSLLQSQTTLQYLGMDMDLFAHAIFRSCASFHHLVELHLRDYIGERLAYSTASLSLPVLQKVSGSLQGGSKDVWMLLLSVAHNTIRSITFDDDLPPQYDLMDVSRSDFDDVLRAIGSSCPSLISLRFSGSISDIRPGPAAGLLHPLLHCSNLSHLEITPSYDFPPFLGDSDIASMALSWPNIEVLVLDMRPYIFKWATTLSLSALDALCVHCPRLRKVSLALNAESIPETPIRLSRLSFPPLESIDFKSSPIEDPEAVATWLGDVCPAEGITFSGTYSEDARSLMWRQVKLTVALLQAASRDVGM
jgi:hypothetical protein